MRHRWLIAAVAAAVAVGLAGCAGPFSAGPGPSGDGPALLFPQADGDGDSWKDRGGLEYRLGLVNNPELDECFGQAASAERKRLTAQGFRAQVYATDDYGRNVSVVTLADGRNLNVLLARQGWANDRYLARFRAENPALAAELDTAFAQAKSERAGLWGACASGLPVASPSLAPVAPGRPGCLAAYPTLCVPPTGPDLDCRDIPAERFKVRAPDPYHFDGNGDGVGCEGPPMTPGPVGVSD